MPIKEYEEIVVVSQHWYITYLQIRILQGAKARQAPSKLPPKANIYQQLLGLESKVWQRLKKQNQPNKKPTKQKTPKTWFAFSNFRPLKLDLPAHHLNL